MKDLEKLEQQVKDMQAEIERLKKVDEKVKPLFPKSDSYVVYTDGDISNGKGLSNPNIASQGNTSCTHEGAEKIAAQRAARAYCLEAINRANKGDNGFKVGEMNCAHLWSNSASAIYSYFTFGQQYKESGWHLRSKDEAQRLQNNPEYVKNFKIAKGVE